MEHIFLRFKIKPPYRLIQGLINSMNIVFYKRSEQFIHSNTIGSSISVNAGVGAAFGKILYDFLIAKSPLGKWIKPGFGFYLASSVGIGISRVNVNDKTAWILDMFFDFESLKRAFAPIFEVDAGVGFSFHMETRELPKTKNRIFTSRGDYNNSMYVPIVGITRTGPRSFSNQHGLNFAFPFPTTLFETNTSRRYLHIVLKDSFVKSTTSARSNVCAGFYKSL